MIESKLSMCGAMMAMVSAQSTTIVRENDEIIEKSKKKPKKIIPKGCKEYYFFQSGDFTHDEPNPTYKVVYYCISSSDKVAIKKFNKNTPQP